MNTEFIAEFQCLQCGAPAELKETTRLFACRYCGVKSYLVPRGEFQYVLPNRVPQGKETIYFPFWRIQADMGQLQLASFADLVKVANLTKAVRPEDQKRTFYFWVPAFRISSHLYLQIAKHVTLCQPQGNLERTIPDVTTYPVNLPMSEALKSLKTVFADFVALKEKNFPRLEEIAIRPKKLALVFLPFQLLGSEVVNPDYRVQVSRRMLEHFRAS